MRVCVAVSLVVLAGALAGSARAQVRPVRPGDAALLRRPPTYEEKIAQQVAAALTHLHPKVRCAPLGIQGLPSSILGVTLFIGTRPAGYFLLVPQMCTDLAAFHASPVAYDPRACRAPACLDTDAGIAMALATVSHESYHLLGYRNEAQVECYGMQSIWYVAAKLGASVDEAEAIGRFYATDIYPQRETQTPAYWTPECRDGGTYDLRPSSRGWPN
jgi:hypothetical protein